MQALMDAQELQNFLHFMGLFADCARSGMQQAYQDFMRVPVRSAP
jgi:hypothetical protein